MAKNYNPTSSHTNYSSDKLMSLIELLAVQKYPARLSELSEQLNMPSSTVLRFLNALMNRDYVAQDGNTGRYFMTFKLCGVSDSIRNNSQLHVMCLPYMRELSKAAGETVNLCVEYNNEVMYIESVADAKSDRMLVNHQYIGHIAPMHCTGVGKLLLLNYNAKQLDDFIETTGLKKYTDSTILTKENLIEELETVRLQGYAYDNEECEMGLRCVAAPIYDYSERIIAGLSISGPTVRMEQDILHRHLDLILPVAKQISINLGYTK